MGAGGGRPPPASRCDIVAGDKITYGSTTEDLTASVRAALEAQPFIGEIVQQNREILEVVRRLAASQVGHESMLAALSASGSLSPTPADLPLDHNSLEFHVNQEIDGYRDLIRADQPKTAIRLLENLKNRHWDRASARVRFRILGNIGAAHHQLGDSQAAADYFLEAAPYDPDAPASIANKIAALVIKGRHEEAHNLAADAFAAHSLDKDVALQRLQARGPRETIDDAWAILPEELQDAPELVAYRIATLRHEDNERWHDLTAAALQAYPDHPGIRALHIDDVIERLMAGDIGAVGLRRDGVPTEIEIRRTAEELEELWKASLDHETPPQPIFAHNAAMLRVILGDDDSAQRLIDALQTNGFQREETKRLAVMLYRRQGRNAQAISVADTLLDTPENRILRADLRSGSAPAEARELLKDRGSLSETVDIIAAALTVCDAYTTERDYAGAEQEIARLAESLPRHPQVALARYRIMRLRGDLNAATTLDEAVRLVGAQA